MSISLKSEFKGGLILFSLALMSGRLWAAPITKLAISTPITSISISFFQTDKNFTAGVATNTTSANILFYINPSGYDPSIINLELLDTDNNPISGGLSPASLSANTGLTPIGIPNITDAPITFFHQYTGLRLRATVAGSSITATSASFNVQSNIAAKLLLLSAGLTYVPGTDPLTTHGYTGTANGQDPNQDFPVTVRLTDNWFNPVSAGHLVTFTPNTDVIIPSPGNLVNGVGSFNLRITAPKTTKTILVNDTTNSSILAGSLTIDSNGPPEKEVFAGPSPFNPKKGETITFRYRMTTAEDATLKVTDQFGQQVWEQKINSVNGFNDKQWDGRNDKGEIVAAGVYYIMLDIGGSIKSKKRFGVVK